MSVSVQEADFDVGAELNLMRANQTNIGAFCNFVGIVRDHDLTLEHYPSMTDIALHKIYQEAITRFDLLAARLIHRYGILACGDQIVLVIAASRHRQSAFDATSFMMDQLKTRVPFWKFENEHWVEQQYHDVKAADSWCNRESRSL